MPPKAENLPQMRFWIQVVLTVFTGILIPIGLNLASKLGRIEDRLDVFDRRVVAVETWIGEGRRYTQDDATRDIGVIAKVIAQQGLQLDDHEERIRFIEKTVR